MSWFSYFKEKRQRREEQQQSLAVVGKRIVAKPASPKELRRSRRRSMHIHLPPIDVTIRPNSQVSIIVLQLGGQVGQTSASLPQT
jgi:hypothetical protein